jgi:hypothetical protein
MHLIEPKLAQQLLGSIESDRLVVFAGAGLSMASPSNVPSAAKIAKDTAAKYQLITQSDVPLGGAENLEVLADFF